MRTLHEEYRKYVVSTVMKFPKVPEKTIHIVKNIATALLKLSKSLTDFIFLWRNLPSFALLKHSTNLISVFILMVLTIF